MACCLTWGCRRRNWMMRQRGFSFRFDAPLDMRMDTSSGKTAAEWLATVDEGLLAEVIRDYGEERFAKQIARAVVAARAIEPIPTTRQLAELVAKRCARASPGRIRRRAPFRLYGFISTRSSKSSRGCCRNA